MPASNALLNNHSFKQWLPWLASLVVVGLLLWWSIVLVLPLFQAESTHKSASPVPVGTDPVSKLPDVINHNLFGRTENQAVAPVSSEPVATRLQLTLRGILATDDPRHGLAQIQQQNDESYFAVGDNVFDQAKLYEIYADRVILLVDGRYETLLLPEEFLNNKHYQASKLKQERKRVATDYRNLLIENDGMELIKLFGFATKFRNGAFQGFVVTALGDKGRKMMAVLGVENGDLIVEVNGLRFSESLEASAQLKDLKTATSINAIISRDGQEIPFYLELDAPVSKYGAIPEGMTEDELHRAARIGRTQF